MRAEFVNPFVAAACTVFQSLFGVEGQKGTLSARLGMFTSQQCNIVLGVTGQLEGQLIYGMSLLTADKIASQMLARNIRTFDELAASAIGELGNMISGTALTDLAAKGYLCHISPPSLLRGTRVKISTLDIPALVVPIVTDLGEIEINLSLTHRLK